MKEKVSVIIPMYNSSGTIIRALDSVKNQTYTGDFEVIVVNDGSTDDSREVVESYIKENPQINIKLINKENGGVSSARNAGLRIAKGEWIALLDSDDEWIPQKTEFQLDYLKKHKEVCLIGSTFNGQVFKSNILKKYQRFTPIHLKDQLIRNHFQPSTVIFRAKALEKVGLFPEGRRYAEEGLFFFNFTYNFPCVLINDSLLNFGFSKKGFGESGLSGNIKEMQKGEIMNLIYIHKMRYINISTFIFCIVYSYLKYLRRIIITTLRKRK